MKDNWRRKLVNTKKVIIILIVALVVIVGGVAVVKLSPSGFTDPIIAKGEEIIMTGLGDKFLLQYETRTFPDYETRVTINDASGKNFLGSYLKKYDFEKPKFLVQIDSQNLRCYKVEYSLIYKVNNGQFKGIAIGSIKGEKIEGNVDLIIAAKALVEKKEWIWINSCGKFLLKAGDEGIRKTLERYASGQFTQEELALNQKGIYKKDDMQAFAKQVLEQK